MRWIQFSGTALGPDTDGREQETAEVVQSVRRLSNDDDRPLKHPWEGQHQLEHSAGRHQIHAHSSGLSCAEVACFSVRNDDLRRTTADACVEQSASEYSCQCSRRVPTLDMGFTMQCRYCEDRATAHVQYAQTSKMEKPDSPGLTIKSWKRSIRDPSPAQRKEKSISKIDRVSLAVLEMPLR